MARTTQQIFDSMVAEGLRLATANGNADMIAIFSNTSKVAVWRLLFYIMAYVVMSFEVLMDTFTSTVNTQISEMKAHRTSWYRNMAKVFQYGFDLIPDTDQFDNGTATDQEIADSLIVKYSAVTETTVDNKRVLLLKIATLSGTDLVPLDSTPLAAFTAYMNTVKDAGVPLVVYNQAADLLKCTVNVYYNPILLKADGMRTDAAGYPVRDAAINYPLTLEFDGEFINAGFIDALQACYGVSRRKVNLVSMERKTGEGDWQSVGSSFIPDAGYCKFDVDGLTINYIADV